MQTAGTAAPGPAARCAHASVCPTCRQLTQSAHAVITADRPVPERVLTWRQVQILQLLADGLIPKQIARTLQLSYQTVRTHLRHIYTVLDVPGQAGAVAWALRAGVIH